MSWIIVIFYRTFVGAIPTRIYGTEESAGYTGYVYIVFYNVNAKHIYGTDTDISVQTTAGTTLGTLSATGVDISNYIGGYFRLYFNHARNTSIDSDITFDWNSSYYLAERLF